LPQETTIGSGLYPQLFSFLTNLQNPIISMQNTAHFLNVDLDIRSKSELAPILKEFGRRVALMHCGPVGPRHLLAVETAKQYKDPDSTTHALCDLVDALSPSARRLWDSADKQFDIGYEWAPGLNTSQFSLRPDTLLRVAQLGARLTITHYREHDPAAPAPSVPRKKTARRRPS
jgi:hypothetical protein